MKEIEFRKISGSGNDFIVTELERVSSGALRQLAISACDRRLGLGADGLLVIQKSQKADIMMRIFNADGSEADMCGNGARCAAFYVSWVLKKRKRSSLKILTRAGLVEAQVDNNNVSIKLTDPHSLKFGIPINLGGRNLKVNFINTGVPHTVIFVEGLDKIDVQSLGRQIRNHKAFAPKGTNVNFVEAQNNNSIKVRTYERGVEAETLACGTGSTASALVYAYNFGTGTCRQINVKTRGGDILKISFAREGANFTNVWLEGKVKLICKGAYYV